MKLSEALRLGEFALPANHGNWFKFDDQDQACGGCAVGRACLAAGMEPVKHHDGIFGSETRAVNQFMEMTWPWVKLHNITVGKDIRWSKPGRVTHWYWLAQGFHAANNVQIDMSNLYEYHGWTMSEIADWIETIEPKEIADPTPFMEDTCPAETMTLSKSSGIQTL